MNAFAVIVPSDHPLPWPFCMTNTERQSLEPKLFKGWVTDHGNRNIFHISYGKLFLEINFRYFTFLSVNSTNLLLHLGPPIRPFLLHLLLPPPNCTDCIDFFWIGKLIRLHNFRT